MKTVTLANQKGGVGKSAVARLLAHYLVKTGHRVLAIDLDHQSNFTTPLKLSGKAAVASFGASTTMTGQAGAVPDADLVLIPADSSGLKRIFGPATAEQHNAYANSFAAFIKRMNRQFDVCIIDTNPNPDIRVLCALVSSDFVLSPIQVNHEALIGIDALMNDPRVGVVKIKDRLNKKLELLGLLPCLVDNTARFQKENLKALGAQYLQYMIRLDSGRGTAQIPKRSIIAEAQASGAVLYEMKSSTARDTWRELVPSLQAITTHLKLDTETSK